MTGGDFGCKQAVEEDRAGRFASARALYCECIHTFMAAAETTKNKAL
jgi:MIT (microtubule interacting and transport) domain